MLKPRLEHLVDRKFQKNFLETELAQKSYCCVMPSSRWMGKEWPTEKYIEVLSKLPCIPVILGTRNDKKSRLLCELLSKNQIEHVSLVGHFDFKQTCSVISGARFYLGVDTGFFHIAEHLGVPAVLILGPTVQDSGFGPTRSSTQVAEMNLWCRPCGKDGSTCHRLFEKHKCLKDLETSVVYKKCELTSKKFNSMLPMSSLTFH